jgi:hypothetical protein
MEHDFGHDAFAFDDYAPRTREAGAREASDANDDVYAANDIVDVDVDGVIRAYEDRARDARGGGSRAPSTSLATTSAIRKRRSALDGFVPLPHPNAPTWMSDALADDDEPMSRSRRDGGKRGKRGSGSSTRTHKAASKAFVERVLAWSVRGLQTCTREGVGEAPMVNATATYETVEHWFAVQEELAYEEARATLAAALVRQRHVSAAFRVMVKVLPSSKGMGRLRMIEATRLSRDVSNDWRRPATAILLKRDASDVGVLAIVAASQEASGAESVPLWVQARDVASIDGSSSTWTAAALDSLISYQRMACACFMRPKVSFAHQLIGHKPSTHTKFVDSDSDYGDDGNEDGKSVRDDALAAENDEDDAYLAHGELNISQRRAMQRFLSRNGHMDQLQMVQGPPGCGKTHFTVSLLRALAKKNRRVLVCAPSNKAVCVALELFLRKQGATDACAPCILLGVEDSLEECSTPSEVFSICVMDYFIYRRASAIAGGIERALADMKAEKLSQFSLDAVGEALDLARKQLKTTAPQFLKGEITSGFKAIESLLHEMDATKASEIQKQGAKLVANISKASGRGERADEFAVESLNRAQLVFCTLASAGQSIMAMLNPPDVLLVDEAAQALEPEIAIPFLRNPSKCLLVGDPAQLPATLSSETARRHGHATSLMERLMTLNDKGVSLLDTQYRMHQEIAHWPSAYFYANRLLTADYVTTRELPSDFPTHLKPYTFVDVHEGEETGKRGASKSNQSEARLACAFIETLVKFQRGNTKTFSVVVITFYSAQVQCIGRMLASHGIKHVAVHSVDSFQGSEADVVICSAVRNNKANTVGFLADKRRLNVALTRAKHALVVLACAKTLSSGNADLKALVDDAKQRGVIISQHQFANSFHSVNRT